LNLCYYGFCFKKKKNTTWHWCFRCFVYTREGVSLCFCYCCFLLMFVRRKYQKCSCSCSIEVKLTNPDAQNAEPNQFMCWDCWRSIFSISFFLPSPLSPRESARCQYPPLNHKSNGGLLCYFDPIKYCSSHQSTLCQILWALRFLDWKIWNLWLCPCRCFFWETFEGWDSELGIVRLKCTLSRASERLLLNPLLGFGDFSSLSNLSLSEKYFLIYFSRLLFCGRVWEMMRRFKQRRQLCWLIYCTSVWSQNLSA